MSNCHIAQASGTNKLLTSFQTAMVSYIDRPNKNVLTFSNILLTNASTFSLGLVHSKLPSLSATKPSSDVVTL